MVEQLGLKKLEPLSGVVTAGLIGFGSSSLDAGVSTVVTWETHWLAYHSIWECGLDKFMVLLVPLCWVVGH